MTEDDRDTLRRRGIGITNVVARATARADELAPEELRAGASVSGHSWPSGARASWR